MERVLLAFGNEGHGLSHKLRQVLDHEVTLPMHDGVDSLNVSVASGIFLHHFAQMRRSKH